MRRIAFHIICGPVLHQYGVDLMWTLRREQKKKRRGEERGDQALVSDNKAVEINVGQYRFCMDAGVIGTIHSRNRLYL
jgi:hypothetical protein